MHRRLCLGRVPILLFHTVRTRGAPMEGPHGELSLEADVFARGLASLRAGGYCSIRCRELHDHLAHGAPLPPRPILLTFDDGWLDHWTVAAPLLAQHGFGATLFVATDLLDIAGEARGVRPTLAEGGGAAGEAAIEQQGYLRPCELRALAEQGVFEIEAHSASHAVLDRTTTPWTWFGQRGPGEDEAAQRARIAADLERCKARFVELLGREPEFLAWPGGGVSRAGLDVARAAGFRATFLTDAWADEVAPGPEAIPRAFFSQYWRGPGADRARVWKMRGVADWESGAWQGYVRLFAANRWMGFARRWRRSSR